MARSFNGTSDSAQATSVNPSGFTAITIAAWINVPSFPAVGVGVPFGYTSSGWETFLRTTGHLGWEILSHFSGGNLSASIDPGAAAISPNIWTHLAVTSAISDLSLKTFVNGVSDGTAGLNASSTEYASEATFFVGNDDSNNFFKGSIADVAIWNTALTQAQITQLVNGARAITIAPASLQQYWPLAGTQSPEPDLSGNNNSLTLTGTTFAADPPILPIPVSSGYPVGGSIAGAVGWIDDPLRHDPEELERRIARNRDARFGRKWFADLQRAKALNDAETEEAWALLGPITQLEIHLQDRLKWLERAPQLGWSKARFAALEKEIEELRNLILRHQLSIEAKERRQAATPWKVRGVLG